MARVPRFVGCSVDDCSRNAHRSANGSRGFCSIHYARVLRHGDPLGGRTFQGEPHRWVEDNKNYDLDSCLTWPFGNASKGYGLICVNGVNSLASRYMCTMAHGEPPTERHQAAHSCHNGHLKCVNPRHLRWATPKENCDDTAQAGNRLYGERSATAKLTADQAMAIFLSEGKQKDIAEKFQVTESTVSEIRNKKSWRHIHSEAAA